MKRARGFSLIEHMISLALGGIVLAGAFTLHNIFNRQSQRMERLADMQQNLRVARQIMERTLRGAGSGLQGAALTIPQCNGVCPAGCAAANGVCTCWAIQFHNSNTYPNPPVDNTPGDTDADPDWVQIIATDPNVGTGGINALGANVPVTDTTGYQAGDLFVAVDTSNNPNRKNCVMQVTKLDNAGGGKCPTCGALQHDPGQSCINLPPGQDACVQNLNFPVVIRRIAGNAAVFRVDKTDPKTPRLMASFGDFTQQPTWQVIAENIEDLQIALVMKDGTVCGAAGNSIDDTTLCPPSNARAVRFTLTARSSSPETGVTVLAAPTGGYEDRPATTPNDGYLRRTVTAEVQLRNMM